MKGLMEVFCEKKLGELSTSVFVRFCIFKYDPRDRGPLNVFGRARFLFLR